MSTVYAFLVGIDAYRAVRPLRGCRNDVEQALALLRTRTGAGTKFAPHHLYDDEATRAAVIDGIRSHLGQAGPGDTALFWFSGHGSQAPVPQELWHTESSGLMQTLVCADSRHQGVPDLFDKEISILLDGVAGAGAHVAVVLDSCHSDGATRNLETWEPAARARTVAASVVAPPVEALLPELRRCAATEDRWWARIGARHVALAACRADETAQEMLLDGEQRGLFSWALLRALSRLGPAATYRELLGAARCEVERRADCQIPQLAPAGGDLADQPFLGGRRMPPGAGMELRYVRGEWEIDAGSCHGLPADPKGELRVAVHGAVPVREGRVTRVRTERSTVEPVGWQPDRDRQYPVVLSAVPLPAVTVAVGGSHDDPETVARVVRALRTAGPGGGPSPHLRSIDPEDPAQVPELRVRVPGPGRVRVLGADGTPLDDWSPGATDAGGRTDAAGLPGAAGLPDAAGLPGAEGLPDAAGLPDTGDLPGADGLPGGDAWTADGLRRTVARLEHIARWRQVQSLANPLSRLAGAVAIEIVEARPGDRSVPRHRPALRPAADGAIRLRYRWDGAGWRPPEVFVRLVNRTGRSLYCVLLDLTDRFQVHAGLFPGAFIAAGGTGAALFGDRVELRLPRGRSVEPGARARDWFMLLVAEEQFYTRPFELPRIDQPPPAKTRRPLAVSGLLDRLGCLAVHRDAGPVGDDGPYDWATSLVPIVTEVPDDPDDTAGSTWSHR